MLNDYKRAVCLFCPVNTSCSAYRNAWWCKTCPNALSCNVVGDVDATTCTYIKGQWQELPSRCLLAEKVVYAFIRSSGISVVNTDGLVRLSDGAILCPRCIHATFIFQVEHVWTPKLGGGGRVSMLKGYCTACALEVESFAT